MNERQQTIHDDAKVAVGNLSALVNCFDDDAVATAFAANMRCVHPTLQQNLMRVFMGQIKAWAENECFDLRSEGTVMLSRKIMEAVKDNAFLPFI